MMFFQVPLKGPENQGQRYAISAGSLLLKNDLITKNLDAKAILNNHDKTTNDLKATKQFPGPVLAYVTPWNSHGYDIAKQFGSKFSLISPVWLQLRREAGTLVVRGDHDIDQGWIKEVNRSQALEFVPRILFDGWSGDDWQWLFSDEQHITSTADVIIEFLMINKFDGIVLELWTQFGGQYSNLLVHLIGHLSRHFRQEKLKFILILPPPINPRGNAMLTKEDYQLIYPMVDAVSLMTYDYSTDRPGANSPIEWMAECVKLLAPDPDSDARSKILLGLNFYGMDFKLAQRKAEPIVANTYIDVLRSNMKTISWSWDEEVTEHVLLLENEERQIYFPTLHSIHKRILLASELKVGLSIWEIGQGLDFFYDLL